MARQGQSYCVVFPFWNGQNLSKVSKEVQGGNGQEQQPDTIWKYCAKCIIIVYGATKGRIFVYPEL